MDRPEDIETNPVNRQGLPGLTNNTSAAPARRPTAANPRPENLHGHIIEITEAGDDHAATTFTWEIFLLSGDPARRQHLLRRLRHGAGQPDRLAGQHHLRHGRQPLDLDRRQPGTLPGNDGLFAVPTDGAERGYLRQFFSRRRRAPRSPARSSTPDNTALFVSIQHPGEGGTYEEPISTFPDGGGAVRPSVVLIRKEDGGVIGS